MSQDKVNSMTDGQSKRVVSIRESDGSIVKLEIHRSLRSTSRLAREYANLGYPDRYAVFAEKRIKLTTGKAGERAETERGLFLSIILRPSLFPSQASLMGALAGTSLVSALEEHTEKKLGIGWVSDVYCDGVKIGGATVEGKLDRFGSYEYIIVSFDIKTDNKNFPPRLTDMMRKVFEEENTSIPMIMARSIISKFFKYYPSLRNEPKFMNTYVQKFVLRGKRVKYQTEQKRISCKVLNVEMKSGALVLEKRNGEIIYATSPKNLTLPKRIRIKKT